MRLKRLYLKNHKTGWCLDDVKFGALTLLVGASGVGKTQTLKAISTLSSISDGVSENGLEWRLVFDEDGTEYVWSGRYELSSDKTDLSLLDKTESAIEYESLIDSKGNEIFSRDSQELKYHGIPIIKLDSAKSAIELLKEQSDIAPIKRAFKKISWLVLDAGSKLRFIPGLYGDINAPRTIGDIKALRLYTPIDKLFLIQKNCPEIFRHITGAFREIFPLVEEVDFAIERIYDEDATPVLRIKEKGVDAWITLPDISAGMCRTLSQIVTLALAEDGDVILIDEFENGLGINCIDSLADMVMDTDANVQIIMTSHHPYIINTIPFDNWRVVSRNGNTVTVHTAAELQIGTHSRHDAFMQLIQTSTYRTGLS